MAQCGRPPHRQGLQCLACDRKNLELMNGVDHLASRSFPLLLASPNEKAQPGKGLRGYSEYTGQDAVYITPITGLADRV
jgi:hypothetical protein